MSIGMKCQGCGRRMMCDCITEQPDRLAQLEAENAALRNVAQAQHDAYEAERDALRSQLGEEQAIKRERMDEIVALRAELATVRQLVLADQKTPALASAAVLELSSELQVVRADLAVARNEFKNRVGTNEQFHELYKLLADVAQPQGTGGSLHTLGVMAIRALQDDLALARAVLDSLRETGRKGDNEVVLLGCRAAWKKWLEKKEVPNGK